MLTMTKRKQNYYSRFRVPVDLQEIFGVKEITRSLHTTKYRQAKSLHAMLIGNTERVCTMLRTGALTTAVIRKLVDDYKRHQLIIDPNFPPPGKGYREILTEYHTEELQRKQDALLDWRGQDAGTEDDARYLLRKAGLLSDEDADDDRLLAVPEFKELCRELAIVNRDIYTTVLERTTTGDSAYDKAERIKPKSHTLKETIKAFVNDKSTGKRKRQEKTEKILEIFQFETGKADIALSDIDYDLTRKVAERLKKYPNYRNSRYKGKSLAQIYKLKEVEFSSETTQKEELFLLSSLYQFGIDKMDGLSKNFAKGLSDKLIVKAKRKASEYKDEFRTADIIEIVRVLKEYKEKGEFVRNPHLLFIPLIGLFQGMRLNEICQLHVTDICEESGIYCIKISEDIEGQSVKNVNSVRVNPMHPKLIELGLVKFWERQREKGYSRLWEGEQKISCACYTSDSKPPTHSHRFGKWFNRTLKDKLVLSNPEKQTFHSTRHTFINWFRQNLNMFEHGEMVMALAGHLDKADISFAKVCGYDTEAETFVTYGKSLNVQRQLRTLELLDYGVDFSELAI